MSETRDTLLREQKDSCSIVNSVRYSFMEESDLSASEIKAQLQFLKGFYHVSLSRIIMRAIRYGIMNCPDFSAARLSMASSTTNAKEEGGAAL